MELNIETLTQEQKKQLDMGYKIYLNENNKLVIEEPEAPFTNEYIEYKKELIDKEFQNTIKSITSKYTLEEREGWDLQLEGAKIVLAGETSPLLEAIVAETGEDINVLAQSIVDKANLYEIEYAKALGIKRAKLSAL